MNVPQPGTRRTIALAFLLVPLALVLLGGWFAWRHVVAQKAELAAIESSIRALDSRLKTREQFLAEVRLLERSSDLERFLIVAETPALAGAELQGVVTRIVAESGGEVSSVQVLEPEPVAPFLRIPLKVEFLSDLPSLLATLHSVETGEPVLFVDRLDIKPLETVGPEAGRMIVTVVELSGFVDAPADQPE